MDALPAQFSPVVVAPSFNNARTLLNILQRIDRLGLPVLIVNDGSTDQTANILEKWQRDREGVWCKVVTHPQNRGKAAALKTAFAEAAQAKFTHTVSIDTDGQLDPEQIPSLLDVARANPDALVVGSRDDTVKDYPARSRIGRRLSNALIYIESGVRVEDSQCGLRIYPLQLVTRVPCRAKYFGFETEIITRAGWANCQVIGVPVRCRYFPPGQRVSHFKPWRDSIRWVLMHSRLLGRALVPIPHTQLAPAVPIRVVEWLSPRRAWRELQEQNLAPAMLATAISLGVFIANLPIYGMQSLASLYFARRLHLHPLAVLLGSQLSMPPINLFLAAAAIVTGHVVLHAQIPTWSTYSAVSFTKVALPVLLDWTIGAVILGLVLSALAFIISLRLFNIAARSERHKALVSLGHANPSAR